MPTEKAYGIQIAKMCEAFSRQNVEVTLLVPFRKNSDGDFFKHYQIGNHFIFKRLWALDFHFPGSLDQAAVGIKNLISAVILAVYTFRQYPQIVYSREELPLYLLSFFRAGLFFEAHRFAPSREFFYRRFLDMGMKIVVISQGIKNAFIQFGFPPERILVAHDGVDIEQFDLDITRDQARVDLNFSQDWLVGYVGQLKTLGMSKGVDFLMKGFAPFHRNHREARLVIVGGAPDDIRESRELAKTLGILDVTIFVGRKPHGDIPKYLKALDALVMVYPNKPHFAHFMSPLKLFEYMASRKPIVASDLPSIREVLNEESAFLVEPDNSEAITRALEDIFSHPEVARAKGERAHATVKEYSWAVRAQNIKEFLHS